MTGGFYLLGTGDEAPPTLRSLAAMLKPVARVVVGLAVLPALLTGCAAGTTEFSVASAGSGSHRPTLDTKY